ncbi:AraC family transcriptional regulator [Paenibacillus chibensis]|uniref:AraC family transcriptional regulator n=1 Tax=Paenibacillus chibensis TaxID=59846 RepID=UPI000FD8092E|nr:AraC family transcriptional regulator [Paenibacillus chibensis]MEC0371751.1 AraC family transcriptional regulator [Paenibacillus chibensis]
MQNRPSDYKVVSQPYVLPSDFPVDWMNNYVQGDDEITYLHFHNCIEIGYCFEGSGVFFIEDKVLPYAQGDVSIIFPNQLHLAQSLKGNVSKWHFCFVDPKALFSADAVSSGFWDRAGKQSHPGFCNIVTSDKHAEVVRLTDNAMKELERRQPGYESAAKGYIWTLLTLIGRQTMLQDEGIPEAAASRADRHDMHKISKALEYISQHYMDSVPVQRLAGVCCLSVTHFRRIFRKCMGMAPLDYINNVRIQVAAALLCHSDNSVLAISEEVGYATLSSFNRQFKRVMGEAPTRWRTRKKNHA